MANRKMYEIAFHLGGKVLNSYSKAMEKAPKDIKKLNKRIEKTSAYANRASNSISRIGKVAKTAATVAIAAFSIKTIANVTSRLADAAREQILNEKRLETVLKQRTLATDDQIDSIIELTSAQEALGVVEGEVQLAGAQQLATFVSSTDTVNKLVPAMNNLLAQQKGLNATSTDAINIGNLMGKVLQGQTGALTRVGITFDDAQEKVLKYGTEAERAAMLAQVITDNVGEMNKTLAQTDDGKILQAKMLFGSIEETLGRKIIPLQAKFAGFFIKSMPKIERATVVVIDKISKGYNGLANIINNIKPHIASLVSAFGEKSKVLATKLYPTIKNYIEIFNIFKSTVKSVFFITLDTIKKVMPKVNVFLENVIPTINKFSTVAKELAIVIYEAFKKIAKTISEAVIKITPVLLDMTEFIIVKMFPIISKVFSFIATVIVPTFVQSFQKWIPKVVTAIKNMWAIIEPILGFLVSAFQAAWTVIEFVVTDAITTVIGFIDKCINVLSGIISFISGPFKTDWSSVWEEIKGIFGSIFENMGDLLKSPINIVIGLINGVIDGINLISVEIPKWVPKKLGGGRTLGFNVDSIPYLAKGTSNFAGGLAVVGEQGRELVNMPPGSQVLPNRRTEKILNGMEQSSSHINITFAPNIVIKGNANKEDIVEATRMSFNEFKAMMDMYLKDNTRVKFS